MRMRGQTLYVHLNEESKDIFLRSVGVRGGPGLGTGHF